MRNGFSDPDFDDFAFRETHRGIYGNSEGGIGTSNMGCEGCLAFLLNLFIVIGILGGIIISCLAAF